MVGKCCSKLFIYPCSYHLCFFPQDECPSQHHLPSFLSPLVFLLFLSAQTSLSFSILNNQPTDYKHQETSSALPSPCNAILPRWASGKYPFLPSPLPQGLCTSYFFCQECSSPSLFCFVLFVLFLIPCRVLPIQVSASTRAGQSCSSAHPTPVHIYLLPILSIYYYLIFLK